MHVVVELQKAEADGAMKEDEVEISIEVEGIETIDLAEIETETMTASMIETMTDTTVIIHTMAAATLQSFVS